jgi:hypothetical protein
MNNDKLWLEKILNEVEAQMRENNLEGFKAVIKSLDAGAMKVLDETEDLWEKDANSKEMKEKLGLLRHYLDYMKRFCEGKV